MAKIFRWTWMDIPHGLVAFYIFWVYDCHLSWPLCGWLVFNAIVFAFVEVIYDACHGSSHG